jgi:hypothetical protein
MERDLQETYEKIVKSLQDRNLRAVEAATGVGHQTLFNIKAGRNKNPTLKNITALIKYFEDTTWQKL